MPHVAPAASHHGCACCAPPPPPPRAREAGAGEAGGQTDRPQLTRNFPPSWGEFRPSLAYLGSLCMATAPPSRQLGRTPSLHPSQEDLWRCCLLARGGRITVFNLRTALTERRKQRRQREREDKEGERGGESEQRGREVSGAPLPSHPRVSNKMKSTEIRSAKRFDGCASGHGGGVLRQRARRPRKPVTQLSRMFVGQPGHLGPRSPGLTQNLGS